MLTLLTGDLSSRLPAGGDTGIPRFHGNSELWSTPNHSAAARDQPSTQETYFANDRNQNLTQSIDSKQLDIPNSTQTTATTNTELNANNPASSSGGSEAQMSPGTLPQQISPLHTAAAAGGNPNLQGHQLAQGIYIFHLTLPLDA